MYADRESGAGKLSVEERLQVAGSGRRRPKYGKRDLRLKLLNKSTQSQAENEGIRDLREKLSGSNNSLQVNNVVPKRRKVAVESKLARKVIGQVPVQEAKKVTTTISQKKSVQKNNVAPKRRKVAPKRRKVAVESKLARKVIGQVPVQEAKKVTTTISQKKSVQKAENIH